MATLERSRRLPICPAMSAVVHRSGRGFWLCGRHGSGRWRDFSPPFAARRRATRLHRRGIDQHLRGRSASLRKRLEQIGPDALGSPAHITIVECLARTVVSRRINPPTTRLQNMSAYHRRASYPAYRSADEATSSPNRRRSGAWAGILAARRGRSESACGNSALTAHFQNCLPGAYRSQKRA